MVAVSQALFLSCVSFLFVHELDAVRQREWRFFFAPVAVSDELAYRRFTALHVPLVVVVLWFAGSRVFQLGVDSFAVVHAILHVGLRNHPLLEFDDWFSGLWILGAALLGLVHLALVV